MAIYTNPDDYAINKTLERLKAASSTSTIYYDPSTLTVTTGSGGTGGSSTIVTSSWTTDPGTYAVYSGLGATLTSIVYDGDGTIKANLEKLYVHITPNGLLNRIDALLLQLKIAA